MQQIFPKSHFHIADTREGTGSSMKFVILLRSFEGLLYLNASQLCSSSPLLLKETCPYCNQDGTLLSNSYTLPFCLWSSLVLEMMSEIKVGSSDDHEERISSEPAFLQMAIFFTCFYIIFPLCISISKFILLIAQSRWIGAHPNDFIFTCFSLGSPYFPIRSCPKVFFLFCLMQIFRLGPQNINLGVTQFNS